MTPIAHFSRRYRLSASHRLFIQTMTDAENASIFGKCANPFGHGHNYIVEVTVSGPIDPETGFVVDMPALDAIAQREIIDRWDHTNLNLDPHFSGTLVPSTENFAYEVQRVMQEAVKPLGVTLYRIHIEETPNNSFDLINEIAALV